MQGKWHAAKNSLNFHPSGEHLSSSNIFLLWGDVRVHFNVLPFHCAAKLCYTTRDKNHTRLIYYHNKRNVHNFEIIYLDLYLRTGGHDQNLYFADPDEVSCDFYFTETFTSTSQFFFLTVVSGRSCFSDVPTRFKLLFRKAHDQRSIYKYCRSSYS